MPTDFAQTLNRFGKERKPFFFIINFEQTEFLAQSLETLSSDVLYAFEDKINAKKPYISPRKPSFDIEKKVNKQRYKEAFEKIIEEIKSGNTYMLNLTFPTTITLAGTLEEIFYTTQAPFKCCLKNHFVCFSPERFIRIEENTISTYPMKGTIDASMDNAQEVILQDEKEIAEHVMVVDLLRNDLSMVATHVCVEKFRYIDTLKAGEKTLLQVSSKITGKLDTSWHERIGDIVTTLLPAGSISGTPKRSSVDIIKTVEEYDRGYFTGVFGIFDGRILDSAVMIRYIEKTFDGYVFKSGGGITLLSDEQKEYDELCSKVYLPVH